MDKSQLRKIAITKLQRLTNKDKVTIEEQLFNHLIDSNFWKKATIIGVTISQGFEWNTKAIIETAWEQGKTICVPKCIPQQRKLDFYQFHSFEQLEIVYHNLLEPKPDQANKITKHDIDLLIVPGLLFNRKGFRVGFGGGYYDRFLTDFTNETVSLTSEELLIDQLPTESFDIPVKHLITESGLLM